ncbi:lipoprotein [Rugamonas sp. FT81W]|uniref:Lipoprotein n=1 Tax=Duganella vulcania TaxID=2692166 RepID=A0A845GRJ9_9BURK|nr:lipoprotein [Duganella vulcania]
MKRFIHLFAIVVALAVSGCALRQSQAQASKKLKEVQR